MKSLILIICSFLFLNQAPEKPKFEKYPVPIRFKGKPAHVDFTHNPSARRFRTVIREGASKGPNFADHYRVVTWGCGSSCQSFAIVNSVTGKVYMPRISTCYGLICRRESNLLITDPIDSSIMEDFGNDIPSWLITRYYLWDGNKLKQIDSSKSVIDIEDNAL